MTDRATQHLECLLQVAQVVNSTLELDDVLRRVLGQARGILGAESGSIMLVEPDRHTLRVLAAEGPRAPMIQGRTQDLGQGVAGWVAQNQSPLLLHGAARGRQFQPICARRDVRDALCVPLTDGGSLLGVVSLSNPTDRDPFSEHDLELLTAIAHQAALAIRNAQSFAEMQRQRATVERLLWELTRAQEEERARISLLLHDGPAQTLFAALRQLEVARVLRSHAGADEQSALVELEDSIRSAIAETRAIMIDLRPLALDDIGLYSALRQYVEQYERRTGMKAQIVRQGSERRLPQMLSSALFRIAQEAMTNIWKHSGATRVQIVLEVGERHCTLEVRDNGCGFVVSEAEQKQDHLGLRSLRDRTHLLGGQFWIDTHPGQGTVVRVSAPLTHEGEHEESRRGPEYERLPVSEIERGALCEA